MTPGPGIGTLYVEELKALTRGRFAWIGAAVVLLAVGGLATVGTQDTWLDGYGIVAYGLVPLAFIPIAAVAIASPRANRFVESVFTAPVDRCDWLVAKVLGLCTLAGFYYLSLVPMALVYVHYVGTPPLFLDLIAWSPGLLLISTGMGTLIGVLFIGRSIAAPAATGMGVLMAYAGLVPLNELLIAQGNGATRSGHVTLMSPSVLLRNALGFTLVAPSVPTLTARTWICLALLGAGPVALAFWVFLRAQGVETWEATRAQRWAISIAIAVMALAPAIVADATYDRPAPPRVNAPPLRGIFGRASSSLAFVPRGHPPPARCCGAVLNRDAWPMSTDTTTAGDLLIFLPVEASREVSDVHVSIVGEGGLEVVANPDPATVARLPGADAQGWVARVPVRLTPTRPWDVGGLRYPLAVSATYRVSGEAEPRKFAGRAAIDAQIGAAIYEMGAASLILPLICFGAAVVRWRRTK